MSTANAENMNLNEVYVNNPNSQTHTHDPPACAALRRALLAPTSPPVAPHQEVLLHADARGRRPQGMGSSRGSRAQKVQTRRPSTRRQSRRASRARSAPCPWLARRVPSAGGHPNARRTSQCSTARAAPLEQWVGRRGEKGSR